MAVCSPRSKVRRWIVALCALTLLVGQAFGSAHALHAGGMAHNGSQGAHHRCHPDAATQGALAEAQDDRKEPSGSAPAKPCCHALCVMAVVHLEAPEVHFPAVPSAVLVPSDRLGEGTFSDRLDRPPKVSAIG